MKNLLCAVTLLILTMSPNLSTAQISQVEKTMSLGPQMGYLQEHQGADKKQIEKAWSKMIKTYNGKVKKNRKSGEFETKDINIPSITSDKLSTYVVIEEKEGLSTTNIYFDNGSIFLDGENASYESENIERFLEEFGFEVQKIAVGDLLEAEEKIQKRAEKDLQKLVKQNENLHQDIVNYEEKIQKAELDIEENIIKQDEKEIEIMEQTTRVEEIKEHLNNIGKSN